MSRCRSCFNGDSSCQEGNERVQNNVQPEGESMSVFEITGKVCLVTGASRGIGAAVARGMGANGANVAVHYRSGRTEAELVSADVEQSGGTALLIQGDIAEPGTVERLVAETVSRF